MSDSEDDASKTEEPSQKKLEEARSKGQIASSREFHHFIMLLGLVFFILILGPKLGRDALHLLGPFITKPDQFEMSPAGMNSTLRGVSLGMAGMLGLTFLLTFITAIVPAIVQRKLVITASNIAPKLSKISPLAGVKRLFGLKALIEFIKNVLKVTVVGVICAMVAMPYRHELPQLVGSPYKLLMLEYTARIAGKMVVAVCIFLFFLSMADYLYQRLMILKSLRMSKQEVKDEYKQQEGDPHVKQRLRQLRRERARKRMMANVPKADVIITNPTHYAVALRYDPATMPAPIVLAKGADAVAARIREVAATHKIPILRNPPLARVLYDTTEIDDEIPIEHYQAVAKIISYVYRLKGKAPPEGKPGGAAAKGVMPTMNVRK